jgi:heme/copper-type cytochrome/quinol oxidase subunit 2
MLAGRYRCPPIFYVAVIVVVVTLVFLGFWAKYRNTREAPVTAPLHDQK